MLNAIFRFHIRPAIAEGDTEVNEVLEVKDIVNFIKVIMNCMILGCQSGRSDSGGSESQYNNFT